MKNAMNRRMFLRGAGGTVMAIPFMPSLLSRAFAAEPKPGASPKCFFAIGTGHGDVWGKNMYPDSALLTQTMNYAGRDVRYGNLPTTPDANGNVVWSPMCTASAQVLTPLLAAKFNILRALDIPYRISHHNGGQLGNFAGTVGNITAGLSNTDYMTATIDQVMAYSPSFYTQEDLNAKMTQRSFCVYGGHLSWNFASPSTKSGQVVTLPSHGNNKDLFDYFFSPGSAFHNVNTFIIDRVKQTYDLLKKDPRLSKGDLARLNQHVERMFEIERKLKVSEVMQGKDGLPKKPSADSDAYYTNHSFPHNPAKNISYCELMNDIIVAAFSTGISRVGTWYQGIKFAGPQMINDWHGNVAHSAFGAAEAQKWTLGWNQGSFEHIMVNLAAKLDAVPASDGGTLLDHCLLMLTSEAGQITHHTGCVNYPVVMAGGAGGYFKTGMFVDFGNTNKVYDDFNNVLAEKPLLIPESPGLYYQQFLANALMSMGVPASEWETFTEFTLQGPKNSTPTKGYGFHYVDAKRAKDYTQAKLVMGDKLPVITS